MLRAFLFEVAGCKPNWTPGSFVEQSRSAPSFRFKSNGHGGGVRSFNPNTSGTLSFNIDTESALHQILNTAHSVDLQFKNIVGPMTVADLNTGETHVFSQAFILTRPPLIKATTGARIPWVFQYTAQRYLPLGGFNRNQVGN